MSPLFSIIIPVYNVAAFLGELVDSLKAQDLDAKEWEVIFINDGSTDNSFELGKTLTREMKNARWISQENQGVGGARNRAIQESKGQYLWFVDSDDFISENILGKIKKRILQDPSIDIWAMSEIHFFEDGREEYLVKYTDGDSSCTGLEHFTNEKSRLQLGIYLFKTSVIERNSLEFLPNIYHEDEEFYCRAFYYARRVSYISYTAYHYRIRQGSIMRSDNHKKRVEDLFFVIESVLNFAKQENTPAIAWRIPKLVYSVLNLCQENNFTDYGVKMISLIRKDEILREVTTNAFSFQFSFFLRVFSFFGDRFTWKCYSKIASLLS